MAIIVNVDLDGGGAVKALKVNVDSVGEKTQLSVRPERVSVDSSILHQKIILLVRLKNLFI